MKKQNFKSLTLAMAIMGTLGVANAQAPVAVNPITAAPQAQASAPITPAPLAAPKSEVSEDVKNEKTLDRIRRTNKIVIGNRSSSIPFSYYGENKKPIGYAIDICLNVAETIKKQYNLPTAKIEFVEVSGDTRIPFVEDGKVDLECGSTTNNADRRKRVDFSIPYYVAGVKILARKSEGIESITDIKGKKVAVGKGTSTIKIVERLNKERLLNLSTIEEKDFPSAMQAVVEKRADIFILDDILLYGERSKVAEPDKYIVTNDFLSVEPLAVMMKKGDVEINKVVNKKIVEMINNGEINKLYAKWFQSPIYPTNKSLNIAPDALLTEVFRMPTHIVGN